VTVLLATNVWHVLPATVRIRPGTTPWSDPKGLVLPLLTLTLAVTPYVARVVRASMVEVLESDYVEMARLKGLTERSVLWRHALPNAIGPTFQVIALNVAYMAGGVVVVESLFNYPGIGLALRDAVREVNLPVVQFLAMLISLIYVLSNLLADLGTIFVTPRLRTRLR
jgi:peptide/nickel transport system permease protein